MREAEKMELTKKTTRILKRTEIQVMEWYEIMERIATLDDISELVEEEFKAENEQLRTSNKEDYSAFRKREKDLDIKKSEWVKSFVLEWQKNQ
jgi:hypothetical protein